MGKRVAWMGEGDGRKMEQRKRLILLIKISSIFPSSLNLREHTEFRDANIFRIPRVFSVSHCAYA